MQPYYQDEWVTIYNADCRDVLPTLDKVDLVLTDPPYGINLDTQRSQMGGRDLPPIHGDDKPFEFDLYRHPAVEEFWFGGDYFVSIKEHGGSWLVWDKFPFDKTNKRFGSGFEVIWSSLPHKKDILRIPSVFATGALMKRDALDHPTQKPLLLMATIITDYSTTTGTILDPFMGSGTTLRAAKDLGRKAIGMEIEERYCEIAAKRMAQMAMELQLVSSLPPEVMLIP